MSRAQMTVLAVVVGIAIFLGVAVTLALLVFSVMSTRDIVRQDSQLQELTSVVSALSQSLQEASSSAELRLETLNMTLESTKLRVERLISPSDLKLDSLNSSFTSSLNAVSSNLTALALRLGDLEHLNVLPTSCQQHRNNGSRSSGVYTLYLRDGGRPFQVYCDMETDNYGWVVFQRRVGGSEYFYRTWAEYKAGFGRLESEFWLGNDKLHRLTSAGLTRLRADLGDWQSNTAYALYSSFSVEGEGDNYRISVSGYSGTAGDSLYFNNNGFKFSTRDKDNDGWSDSCAVLHSGAWWYGSCGYSNLNGLHNNMAATGDTTNYWKDWKGYTSLKRTEMKIR